MPQNPNIGREILPIPDLPSKGKPAVDVRDSEVPLRYVGTCLGTAAIDLVAKLLDRGVYVNPAAFPAVSSRRAGARFTITRHQS